MSKFGAIDIGTNAARLLIGEVDESNGNHFVKKISYTRIPLRLGMEVFEKGEIGKDKINEFVKSMHAFKLISEVFKVKELRACATSAMREADNGKEVKKLIKKETGVDIEIIDGSEEASLILSNFFLMDMNKKTPFVVIDVGGGSTEISIFRKGERHAAKSFRVGTIRLLKGKVKSGLWDDLEEWISEHFKKNTEYRIFGTGGNINKIHKMLGMKNTEPIKVSEFRELHGKMAELSLEQRVQKYKLKPDRADVIIPACEIYGRIFDQIGNDEIFVPKIGLSDGIIYNMHKKHNRKKK